MKDEMGGTRSTRGGTRHTKFKSENVKEWDSSLDLGRDGRITLKYMLKEYGALAWTDSDGLG
jgi:hypothetical protein